MTAPSPIDSAGSHRGWLAPVLFGIVVFFLLLGQWQPLVFIDVALEPWILVLSDAAAGAYRFGTDIVFTHGPLSDVLTRLFNPRTYVTVLVVVYGLVALQTISLATLAARSESAFFKTLLLAPLFFVMSRDVLVMLTPLPFALLVLGRPIGRSAIALSVVGAIASAVSTHIKFSVFPLAIALFLLVDVNRIRLGRIPVATVAYGVALYLSFLSLAPSGSDFAASLKGSFEQAAGYSGAMATEGPWTDLAVYGGLALATIAWLVAIGRRRRSSGGAVGWNGAGQILASAIFVWLTFKIAFVRHDYHALTAFSGIALAICAYGLCRPPNELGRASRATIAAVVLVAGIHVHVRLANYPTFEYPMIDSLTDALTAAPREIGRTAAAVADPKAWLADRLTQRDAALAAMAARSPVAGLDGTMDGLAPMQASLIAAGIAYRPRPTIQEYATYTHALIKRNQDFFAGPSGPEYFLFDPVTIDNRYRALAEGASWPIFLSTYAPQRFIGEEGVLLRRRRVPLGEILGPGVSGSGRLGAPLPIVFGPEPLFLSIDVKATLLGRIAEFLFKPSFLYLGVTLAEGPEQIYRLVPTIARDGFLASPMVQTAWNYVRLAEGASADAIQPVKAMRVFAGFAGDLAFESSISYTARPIDRARLAAGRDWSLSPDQAAAIDRARGFDALIAAAGRPELGFRIVKEGLYAHAPRRFPVGVSGAGALQVAFGMRPGSWGAGATGNGVCFRVLDATEKTGLWEQCLDPVAVEEDRGLRRASIALPAGTERVVLETDCRGDCGWDWSYWSEIEPAPR